MRILRRQGFWQVSKERLNPKAEMQTPEPPAQDRVIVSVDPCLQALVPTFLERRQQDLKELHAALESGNLTEVQTLGHRMKGSGGGFGFDFITEIGTELEASAMNSDAAAIEAQIESLRNYLARVEVVYDGQL